MFRAALLWLLLIALPTAAGADRVLPIDRVSSRVVVRAEATRASADVGSLRPGESAEWIGSAGPWHEVRLSDGARGFVSAAWTLRIIEAAPDPEPVREPPGEPPPPPPSWLTRLRALFGAQAPVQLLLRQPTPGISVHEHHDPNLPVSGFASPTGAGGSFDVMLAIDTSTSTLEFAETDVDGDGVLEDEWKGDDSVFHAQLQAATSLITTLRRLPRNAEGERIRVGLVTFAGSERYYRRAQDRDLEPTPFRILSLGQRDARVVVPLTSDYESVRWALRELSHEGPEGMTDVAGGIGRALAELFAFEELGAQSPARPDAQKVIHLITDGKPRLPYDRDVADRAAMRAAKLANRLGVRVNTFALGNDAVTRDENPALERVASRTDGRYLALDTPGDVVTILKTASFSFVDRVKLVNLTTREESEYIQTGIDGSFYGEIPLEPGDNEIEVVAVLGDDEAARERFRVAYSYSRPKRELVDRLERVRAENEALIEQIREGLAQEIREARARQIRERSVELRGETGAAPGAGDSR